MWPQQQPASDLHRERVERVSRNFSLALAPQHASRQKRSLIGHQKVVEGLAWNSTGTRLASVGRDAVVRVWTIDHRRDIGTQQIDCVELKGHTSDVEKCTWNPTNPDQLATCSFDRSIRLWDARAGKLLHSLPTIGENIHIKWSPCGRFLVFCNNNNMVSLVQLDTATKKPQVIKSVGFNLDINAIEWEKNSERFLLGYQRGTIEVVQVPSLTTVASIPCHSTTIFSILFDPKHKYLATGSADSVVNLWNTQEMVCARSFTRLDDTIRTISFSGDSQYIAYGGKDNRIEISDVESGARVHLLETAGETLALAFHPSSLLLAYSNHDTKAPSGAIHLVSAVHLPVQAGAPAATATTFSAAASSSSHRPGAGGASHRGGGRGPSHGHGRGRRDPPPSALAIAAQARAERAQQSAAAPMQTN